MGQHYIVQSFMTVVVGGVGNIWGTLAGAGMIGFLQKGIEWLEPVEHAGRADLHDPVHHPVSSSSGPRASSPSRAARREWMIPGASAMEGLVCDATDR
jgi:hypothetical protein